MNNLPIRNNISSIIKNLKNLNPSFDGILKANRTKMEMLTRYKRKCVEKPPIRPKPAYLRYLFGPGTSTRLVKEATWARRVRVALATDVLHGRCRAADNAITAINKQFHTVLWS